MRALRCIFTGFAILSACDGTGLSSASGDLAASPAEVVFPTTWVGHPTSRQLTLRNDARATKRVVLTTAAPFTAPRALDLRGGEVARIDLVFAPDAEGTFEATLLLDSDDDEHLAVHLSGEARVPPGCAIRACFSSHFDPVSGTCREEMRSDGTACEAACLDHATCRAGTCTGTPATCDDGNACTADACDAGTGCVHVDVSCAAPTETCRAALCDPSTGCTSVVAPDGTACGPMDCTAANVCVLGACVVVEPPDGTACGEPTPCRDRGRCENRACVLPPTRTLEPAWSIATGLPARDVIFPGVADVSDNVYWVEVDAHADAFLVSVTAAGLQRFRVELPGEAYPLRDAYQGRLLLAGDVAVVALGGPHVAGLRTSDGALVWSQDLRATLGTDPQDGLFAGPVVVDGEGNLLVRVLGNWTPASLLTMAPESGEILETRDGPRDLMPLVGAADGRTYRLDANPGAFTLVAMEGAAEPWNVAATFHAAATADGVLVGFADGWSLAGRSEEAGEELWRLGDEQHPLEYQKWTPVLSGGIGHAYTVRAGVGYPTPLQPFRFISFDTTTGTVLGQRQFSTNAVPGTAPLLTESGTILLGTKTGNDAQLWELTPETVEPRWACSSTGTSWEPFSILVRNRWITSTNDGRIVAYDTPGLELARTGWVAPGGNAQRTGRAR